MSKFFVCAAALCMCACASQQAVTRTDNSEPAVEVPTPVVTPTATPTEADMEALINAHVLRYNQATTFVAKVEAFADMRKQLIAADEFSPLSRLRFLIQSTNIFSDYVSKSQPTAEMIADGASAGLGKRDVEIRWMAFASEIVAKNMREIANYAHAGMTLSVDTEDVEGYTFFSSVLDVATSYFADKKSPQEYDL